MILIRISQLFFVLVLALGVLLGPACFAAPLIPQVVEFEIGEVDDDDEEFEDEEEFKNNPWQLDERKLFAAKKFQLINKFAVKVAQIDSICGLDKKQQLKLKIASKGATEEALDKFEKQWREQMKNFGGFNQAIDNDDDDKKKKKRKKKKKKRIVIKKVDEIDAQVMQMLEGNMFGGTAMKDGIDVPVWNKTVEKVLDAEQQKKFKAHVKKLKLARREVRADAFVSSMRLELALSDSQVKEFDKLVRPAFLKKDIDVNWQYDSMATLYFGSKYNKKKMKELLSEEQYLILTLRLKPAETYSYMFGDNVAVKVDVGPQTYVVKLLETVFGGLEGLANDIGDAIGGAVK